MYDNELNVGWTIGTTAALRKESERGMDGMMRQNAAAWIVIAVVVVVEGCDVWVQRSMHGAARRARKALGAKRTRGSLTRCWDLGLATPHPGLCVATSHEALSGTFCACQKKHPFARLKRMTA